MRRLPLVLAAAYLAGGAPVWISFIRTNHDGLANIGLVLYVLPVSAVGLALGYLFHSSEFVFIPDRFGYIGDHAVFFFPSLAVTALLIAVVGSGVRRLWGRKAVPPPLDPSTMPR